MRFSLVDQNDSFIQTADDIARLKTNLNQVRAWCDTIGKDFDAVEALAIVDNRNGRTITLISSVTPGSALRWKPPSTYTGDVVDARGNIQERRS